MKLTELLIAELTRNQLDVAPASGSAMSHEKLSTVPSINGPSADDKRLR